MPRVSSGSHLSRYERSPPPVQRSLSITVRTATNREPDSGDVTLTLRQQPKEALITTEGKEKARKPVDPPPIIQLTVKPHAEPAQHFLQSPYLFMCTSLYKAEKDEAWDISGNKSLAGSLVSSLHRLKDVDNKDGGFFVFGDISCKVQGSFRLHFSLFDLRKDTNEVQYLGCITSDIFRVLLPKDFKGMDESTYLSRAFSDQGVRLRLRKEPRAMMGNKRSYPYGAVDTPQTSTTIRPNTQTYSDYSPEEAPATKRYRPESNDARRDTYSDPTTASGTSFASQYAPAQYSIGRSSIPPAYSLGSPYPNFGSLTTGSTAPYQFARPLSGLPSNHATIPNIPSHHSSLGTFTSNHSPVPNYTSNQSPIPNISSTPMPNVPSNHSPTPHISSNHDYSMLSTSGAALGSNTTTSQPYADLHHQSYSSVEDYEQPRGPASSLSFPDDATGLPTYRTTTSNVGTMYE
ncbi:hypothetical protein K491DRAFT_714063 [Lophiostoma macrostomum CBS 122681]|uniref:Velvet domain-containing protein n=1 Tax=Lophiostoma macrostomum CBS 122681 TaxID=1314788 RepID=A0A6A6TH38_9PLEO|nr:hypothetical protein K491DRAFT_714063 [Lophiostoma macrostomum CBS 122681]